MRIWMLNHYAVPLDGSGGTRHAVLGKYLQEAGHAVTIFASATPHVHLRPVELPPHDLFTDRTYDGVRFRFVRTAPYQNSVQRFLNMLSYRRNVCHATAGLEPPDVVIGSCVHLHAADAGQRLARRYRVPFIYEIRDTWPEALLDVGALTAHHPAYWYLRRIELNLYRRADRVITLLPGMTRYLERHGVPREHIWYIPNGIDPSLYTDIAPWPSSSDPFVISFFGAHGPGNALDTVVMAAAELQEDPRGAGILLRLVGDGSSRPELEEMARALGLRNIEFLAPVPKPELAPLAEASHAFVFHLRDMSVLREYGVSSNKLFDYLMAGRPTIFACNSYNNPVAEADAGISIPPQDPRAMAEALIRMRDLPAEERRRMGERGRVWVLEHHDMRRIARQLEESLRSLKHNSDHTVGSGLAQASTNSPSPGNMV